MSTQLVTVVMMSKDRAGFLPASVGSVLGQTHEDLEVFLVNDGSTDETPQVMEELARGDPRIRVIHNPEPVMVRARNMALDRARGPYFAAIDDDDLWLPEKIEEQLKYADDHSVVGSYCLRKGREAFSIGRRYEARVCTLRDLLGTWGGCFSPSQLLTTTEHARAVGGYDEEITGARGYDFAIRLMRRFGDGFVAPAALVVLDGARTAESTARTGRGLGHYHGMRTVFERYKHLMTPTQRRMRRAGIEFRRLTKTDRGPVRKIKTLTRLLLADAPTFPFCRHMSGVALRAGRAYLRHLISPLVGENS